MGLAWPIPLDCAGAAGTAALTATSAAERRLRRSHAGQLDYDDSLVPGQIVASVMHLPNVTARGDRDLGLALRWGYGSAFGLLHGVLRRAVREPWASAAFGATLMTATVTLFPLLGHTPAPRRWPPPPPPPPRAAPPRARARLTRGRHGHESRHTRRLRRRRRRCRRRHSPR